MVEVPLWRHQSHDHDPLAWFQVMSIWWPMVTHPARWKAFAIGTLPRSVEAWILGTPPFDEEPCAGAPGGRHAVLGGLAFGRFAAPAWRQETDVVRRPGACRDHPGYDGRQQPGRGAWRTRG